MIFLIKKKCSICEKSKSIKEFYTNSNWCKTCNKKYAKEKHKKFRKECLEMRQKEKDREIIKNPIIYNLKFNWKELHLQNTIRRMFYAIRKRAKDRNLEFNLTLDDIKIPEICPVLNVPICSHDFNNSPSINRIDNSKGYVKGNIAIISNRANRIKNDATIDELEAIVKWMKKNIRQQTSVRSI